MRASPFDWTPEIEARILDLYAEGRSIAYICALSGMPNFRQIARHRRESPDFARGWEEALEDLGDVLLDESRVIADDSSGDMVDRVNSRTGEVFQALDHEHVQRDRLRIDVRRWAMTKVNPRRYGDRQQVALTGATGGAIEIEVAARAADKFLADLSQLGSRIAESDDEERPALTGPGEQ